MIHDSLSFPCPQSPNLFKLFWGGVSSTRNIPQLRFFFLYLNASESCLLVARGTRVVWSCRDCLCARFTSRRLVLPERPEGSALRGLWKEAASGFCPPRSPDGVSAVRHTYTGHATAAVVGELTQKVLTEAISELIQHRVHQACAYGEVVSKLSEIVKVEE